MKKVEQKVLDEALAKVNKKSPIHAGIGSSVLLLIVLLSTNQFNLFIDNYFIGLFITGFVGGVVGMITFFIELRIGLKESKMNEDIQLEDKE